MRTYDIASITATSTMDLVNLVTVRSVSDNLPTYSQRSILL